MFAFTSPRHVLLFVHYKNQIYSDLLIPLIQKDNKISLISPNGTNDYNLDQIPRLSFQCVRNTGPLFPQCLRFKRDEAGTLEPSLGKSLRHLPGLAGPWREIFTFQKVRVSIWDPSYLFSKGQRFFSLLPREEGDGCLSPVYKWRKYFFPSLVCGMKPATHKRIFISAHSITCGSRSQGLTLHFTLTIDLVTSIKNSFL